LSHEVSHPDINFVTSYLQHLQDVKFPYDISYIRWSGHGDNAVPDLEISEFVKNWNSTYSWPRFVITSTSKAFHAFEDRYAARIPKYQGDWTGYWEDGAGSSAYETSENRMSSSRLSQANSLWAISDPKGYPAGGFADAWRNILLYSEHTWGADISVTDPLSQKTKEQWEIKKSYATTADSLSRQLMRNALAPDRNAMIATNAIDVFNTNSWTRTGLVLVPAALSTTGDIVKDASGKQFPAQRLSTGELAFIVKDIPAFSFARYTITTGSTSNANGFANGNILDNGILRVIVDPVTGSVSSLRRKDIVNNFSDSASGTNLNEYLFLKGDKLADLQRNGPVTISVKESGPVMTTLLIESSAPGCKSLKREISLTAGADYIELSNILDKEPAELNPHPGDYHWANIGGKESVHIAFPFHVPGGQMRIDIPMAVMQPEKDQIPGSCKNWLETGSWADVSNDENGITWTTLDAPLVEAGEISAILLGGQGNPDVWRKKIEPTQRLYSWALNNHWETNYRAYQDGLITFRYALRPHAAYDAAVAARFATGLTQPLVTTSAVDNRQQNARPLLGSGKIMALVFKPGEDGNSYILTLYNPTDKTETTSLRWSQPVGKTFYSNTSEEDLSPVTGDIQIAPMQVVTLKVTRKPA
jgi:hypothetical protein